MSTSTAVSTASQTDGSRHQPLWLALLVIGVAGSSLVFACVTPFATLATLAALKMSRMEGAAAVGLSWLANQAIGYAILGYPWTWDSLAWGVAIGASSYLALLAAMALSSARPVRMAMSLPFVAAFVVYELGLYVAGFVLPGTEDAFAVRVVEQVFVVNLVALLALLAVHQLALGLGALARSFSGGGLATVDR